MRAAQRRQRPLVDGENAPQMEIGRRETRHCISRGVGVAGMGGLRPAVWRNSAAMRAAQHLKRPPCGQDSGPQLEAGQQKSGRASPVCGALLTISDQSGHMLVHQS